MLFKTDLEIPSGQEKDDPVSTTMKLCEGAITRSFVLFPSGCAGLAWVQIWLNGYQLIPWERGEWLRGDDHIIRDDSRYPVSEQPRLLTIYGYNEDETYPHTIQVGVEVSASEVIVGLPPPDDLLRELGLL